MTEANDPAHSDPDSAVLVEFVGIPGAGKSTLASELARLLRADSVPIRTPISEVNAIDSRPLRILRKSAEIGRYTLRHPYGTIGWLRTVRRLSDGSIHDVAKVGFNWLFVAGCLTQRRSDRGVTIADQGLLQAYWSTILGSSTPSVDDVHSIIETAFPDVPLLVVLVEVDTTVARQRLAARSDNPSRVSVNIGGTSRPEHNYSVEDAQIAYDHVKKSLIAIETASENSSVIRCVNDEPSDVERNVEAIRAELSERFSG